MARRAERGLGTYDWLGELKDIVSSGTHNLLTFDYLRETHGCVAGDPEEVIGHFKAYEATGADLILCLVNPYKIPHDKVMQTIELMGKDVIRSSASSCLEAPFSQSVRRRSRRVVSA